MRSTRPVISISLYLLLAGCGGEEVVERTPDERRATAIVRGLYQLDAARAAANGTGVAFAMRFLALDLASSVPGPEGAAPELAARAGVAPAIGGCTCTEAGCEFTACRDDHPELGWELTGSVAASGGRTTFDVSYADRFFTWSLTGDVELAADRAAGTLASDQECCTERTRTLAAVELREVAVDAMGCPIGGTLHGDLEVAVPGDPTRAYHVAGELAFGPTCFRPEE